VRAAGKIGDGPAVFLSSSHGGCEVIAVFNFSESIYEGVLPLEKGSWRRRLDSSEACWDGPGTRLPDVIEASRRVAINGHSAVILERIAGRGA
jgi:hypothetical protein